MKTPTSAVSYLVRAIVHLRGQWSMSTEQWLKGD